MSVAIRASVRAVGSLERIPDNSSYIIVDMYRHVINVRVPLEVLVGGGDEGGGEAGGAGRRAPAPVILRYHGNAAHGTRRRAARRRGAPLDCGSVGD